MSDFSDSRLSRRVFLALAGGSVVLTNTSAGSAATPYPLYHASGSPRELGREHGEQAAPKIKAHLDKIAREGGYSQAQLRTRARAFQPFFQKYCAHLLDEIQGLAEGARVSLADALAVNIRDPLKLAPAGCTSFVVSRSGAANRQILAGKNCDMDPGVPPLGYMLHLKPLNKPEVLMWTLGGMIGYHGMNSAGVAEFDNALFGEGPPARRALPHYPLKRLMLECSRVDQIIELYRTIPVAMNTNYALCDGHGNMLDIEATTAGPEILRADRDGFVVHTNHYLSSRYAGRAHFPPEWKDSFARLPRIRTLIEARYGALTLDDCTRILSDHDGHPTGICRHAGRSLTVASLIAEPAERRMHVTCGNPCVSPYVTYTL